MLHLRFKTEISNDSHAVVTIFFNGKNIGDLKMTPAEAIWFHHILSSGCESLDFKFISTGNSPTVEPEDIDKCAIELTKDHRK